MGLFHQPSIYNKADAWVTVTMPYGHGVREPVDEGETKLKMMDSKSIKGYNRWVGGAVFRG